MNRKIAKTLSILLALTALAVTQVPVSDAEASAVASDFEMEGNKLLKYTGTKFKIRLLMANALLRQECNDLFLCFRNRQPI